MASLQAALENSQNIPRRPLQFYALLAQPGALFPPPVIGSPIPYPAFSYSLFVNALAPHHRRLGKNLPGPLSDALVHLSETLGEVIAKVLAVLPDPINPYLQPPSASSVANFSVTIAPPPPPPQPIEDGVN